MPPAGDGTYLNRPKEGAPGQLYLRISRGPQRGRYVHQLVAEAKIGRSLFSFETVHHIDGNHLNNDPSNLEVVKRSDHTRIDNERRRVAVTPPSSLDRAISTLNIIGSHEGAEQS